MQNVTPNTAKMTAHGSFISNQNTPKLQIMTAHNVQSIKHIHIPNHSCLTNSDLSILPVHSIEPPFWSHLTYYKLLEYHLLHLKDLLNVIARNVQ